ncbi:MAG: F0F1 ATP synthase subunit A [Acidimicrobiia bacterium]|nr:MAG: F0F1 ATP synthase subunit A [Acidimicrobiia bacterium]
MDQLILAAAEEACDLTAQVVCAPADVSEIFVFREEIFNILGLPITRTVFLIFLAGAIAIGLLYFGLRKRSVQPGKFQLSIEGLMTFVRDEVAVGIIGPTGIKYFPYLMALFIFILIGNSFEVIPFINFPITSRIAIPVFLSLLTWVIFIVAGFKRNGISYLMEIIWPPGVPVFLKPLVGLIEFISTFLVRPFSLAIRLFANLVAGHVMLVILVTTAFVSIVRIGEIGVVKGVFGIAWWALALAIFIFELVVIILQAYIFTLLSAVYIDTAINVEH